MREREIDTWDEEIDEIEWIEQEERDKRERSSKLRSILLLVFTVLAVYATLSYALSPRGGTGDYAGQAGAIGSSRIYTSTQQGGPGAGVSGTAGGGVSPAGGAGSCCGGVQR